MSPKKTTQPKPIAPEYSVSPAWSSETKQLIAFVLIAICVFLLWKFSVLITPLLMVIIVAYLLHPITAKMSSWFRISWSAAVVVIYLTTIAAILTLITLGGVGLVQQIQSLIVSVQDIVADLPAYINKITSVTYQPFGLFTIDLSNLDLNTLGGELTSYIQPILGQTGTIVGTLAASTAESIGWLIFIITVSFFVMLESSGERRDIIKVNVPGYQEDVDRITQELSRIWNAFLRGQFIIFFLALIVYSILLPIFGVRYSLGIALMAAIAKFLPYIGPAITWTVLALVSFFQAQHPFGMQPFLYTILVLGIILLIDQIIDSIIAPRIMADALKVHPAAVLVAIIMGATLFGLLGVIIAAPLLATFTLLIRYAIRKIFDLDPWPQPLQQPKITPESKILARIRRFFRGSGLMQKK